MNVILMFWINSTGISKSTAPEGDLYFPNKEEKYTYFFIQTQYVHHSQLYEAWQLCPLSPEDNLFTALQPCLPAAGLERHQASGPCCDSHSLECPYLVHLSRQRHKRLGSTWPEAQLRMQHGEQAGAGHRQGLGTGSTPLSSPGAPPPPHDSPAGPQQLKPTMGPTSQELTRGCRAALIQSHCHLGLQ